MNLNPSKIFVLNGVRLPAKDPDSLRKVQDDMIAAIHKRDFNLTRKIAKLDARALSLPFYHAEQYPLPAAILKGDIDMIAHIVSLGAEPLIPVSIQSDQTSIEFALAAGREDIARLLIDMSSPEHYGSPPRFKLLYRLIDHGSLPLVQMLMTQDMDIDRTWMKIDYMYPSFIEQGRESRGILSPLMHAVKNKKWDIYKWMVAQGGDPACKNPDGICALEMVEYKIYREEQRVQAKNEIMRGTHRPLKLPRRNKPAR